MILTVVTAVATYALAPAVVATVLSSPTATKLVEFLATSGDDVLDAAQSCPAAGQSSVDGVVCAKAVINLAAPGDQPSQAARRHIGGHYILDPRQMANHIEQLHGPGSTHPNKSKFADDEDIKSVIHKTLTSEDSVVLPNTRERSGFIFEYDFGSDIVIGFAPNGEKLSKAKVVVAPNGYVITAYPIK